MIIIVGVIIIMDNVFVCLLIIHDDSAESDVLGQGQPRFAICILAEWLLWPTMVFTGLETYCRCK